MPEHSEGATVSPSETETPKRGRGAKIVGAWFVGSIWLVILLFSPLRPFNEIWTQPRIFIFTPSGQLDLPNTVLWIIATIISIALVYFGVGSLQSSTYKTNIVQTPSEWMVRFIISFCWNAFHKTPSIQEDELFKEVSAKIPVISSLEGTVDVGKLFGAGSGDITSPSGESSQVERVLARIERLSQRVDVSGTILAPVELEDGKKAFMRLNYEPKRAGDRGAPPQQTALSTHMLLDPHDYPDLELLSVEERKALGLPETKPDGKKSQSDTPAKDSPQSGV